MDGGVNADGIIRVIPELVVQRAPVYGGIQAQGHIAHLKGVNGALHNLQIRVQGTHIEGRGHLAHTAAHLGLGLHTRKDRGLPIALGLRPLAHHLIEGEGSPGLQNVAVNGLTGQNQVVGTVIVPSVLCLRMGQHILEQIRLQGGLGVLRHQNLVLHLQAAALRQRVQLQLNLLRNEAIAQRLLGGHIGLLVQNGVHRLGAILLKYLCEIQSLRLHLVISNGDGAQVSGPVGLQNPVIQSVRIQVTAGNTRLNAHNLAVLHIEGALSGQDCNLTLLGIFLRLPVGAVRQGIFGEIRLCALHGDGGLGQSALNPGAQLIHRLPDIGGVQAEIIRYVNGVGGEGCGGTGLGPLEHVPVPAVFISSLGHRLGIQAGPRILRGEHQRPVLQLNSQALGIEGTGLIRNRPGRLLLGHALQIHIQSIDIFENQAVVPGVHIEEHPGSGQNHNQESSQHNEQLLFPAAGALRLLVLVIPGHAAEFLLQPLPLHGGTALTRLLEFSFLYSNLSNLP